MHWRTAVAAMALGLATMGPAAAEDGAAQRMADELKALIERGEQERAADRWYLRELRDLAAKYSRPWRTLLYSEPFDRNGGPPDPWRVVQGTMQVEPRYGLRSFVRHPEPARREQAEEDSRQQRDPGQELLGTVLKGVLDRIDRDNRQETRQEEPASRDDSVPAVALAETRITNAFELSADWSLRGLSDGTEAKAALGVYQAIGGTLAGYQLAFDGADDRLAIVRVSSRGGRAILDYAGEPVALDDGADHRVVWTRDPGGRMVVTVDGAEAIRTLDRAFNDPWHGIVLRNDRGDVALNRVQVMGTE